MQIWLERSTEQIFGNARPGKDSPDILDIHAARNSYASVQIVVRNLEPFTVEKINVRRIGARAMRRGSKVRIFRQEYTTYNDRTSYPDKLTELRGGKTKTAVKPHCAQVFRVDFYVPDEAKPGFYQYAATVVTDKGDFTVEISLIVHRATVNPPAESAFGHEYFFNTQLLPKEAGVKMFTEEWWELLGHYADVMRELRNNTICVSASLLSAAGSCKLPDGTYRFVWDYFDRYVNLFIDRGAARGFTMSAIMQSVEGKAVYAIGENGKGVSYDTFSPEAEEYIRALYTALEAHLKEKGWDKIFRSHIEDEPHTTEGWLWADKIISEAAPSIVTGEPLDMIESARVICETAKWAVPRINVHDEDQSVFKKMIGRGGELWLYSCCFPEEAWWLNKFVDLPVIRSRLMEWACIDVGAKGFLHWGFNYWGDGNSLYGFNADARFKGDGAIVYPNVRRKKLDLSARFMNTRDGLQDADLFMQIFASDNEELKADALSLLKRTTGGNFTTFSDNSALFEHSYGTLLHIADGLWPK
jgi:hypothetical protein